MSAARRVHLAAQRWAAGAAPWPPHAALGGSYRVGSLPSAAARTYVCSHHYTRSCHARPWPCYGLWTAGGELVGVCCFACPCAEAVRASLFGPAHTPAVLELHRLFVAEGTPPNTESWFVARCLRALVADRPATGAVIAFADPTPGPAKAAHRGTIYQALGARFCGYTQRRRFWRDPAGRQRHPRQCGHNVTVAEAAAWGWTPLPQAPKLRYVLEVGDRRCRRLHPPLRLPAVPYPDTVPAADRLLQVAAWCGRAGLPWPQGGQRTAPPSARPVSPAGVLEART